MTATSIAGLAGLLAMAAAQDVDEIVARHDLGTEYNRADYESACGSTMFRIRFRNGPDGHGHVDHVLIDGRSVSGAADALEVRAARRVIAGVEIMNCGMDPRRPVFRGVMELSKIESRRWGRSPSAYFRLIRQGDKNWRLVFD